MIEWQSVPGRFHYFRNAVEACGETRIMKYDETQNRHIHFVEIISSDQLALLTPIFERVRNDDELECLWDWLKSTKQGTKSEKAAAWRISGILMAIGELGERGVAPFSCKEISSSRPIPPLQGIGVLAQLPEDLSYLVAPALKYGIHHFDQEIFDFLDRATDEEMEELAATAERVLVNDHFSEVMQFLDRFEITDYQESAHLYFLFGVLDYADLKFDRVPDV